MSQYGQFELYEYGLLPGPTLSDVLKASLFRDGEEHALQLMGNNRRMNDLCSFNYCLHVTGHDSLPGSYVR